MKIGDRFRFNVKLMKENNISCDGRDSETVYTVLNIETHQQLGTIIGYKLLNPDCPGWFAQTNECWCIPVLPNN